MNLALQKPKNLLIYLVTSVPALWTTGWGHNQIKLSLSVCLKSKEFIHCRILIGIGNGSKINKKNQGFPC
jgi:hypothetical protein